MLGNIACNLYPVQVQAETLGYARRHLAALARTDHCSRVALDHGRPFRPADKGCMGKLLFTCPVTGIVVQHWLADDDRGKPGDCYQSIVCQACARLHFVNRKDRQAFRTKGGRGRKVRVPQRARISAKVIFCARSVTATSLPRQPASSPASLGS